MDSVILKRLMYVFAGLCLVLTIVVIALLLRPTPNDQNDEVIRLEERIEGLKQDRDKAILKAEEAEIKQDSALVVANKAEGEKNYYKRLYWHEKNRVANLPLDSGVVFLSGWLSKGDSL